MAEHNFEGILVLDKKKGPTSHDVVADLRSITGVRRLGHCGTLDPLASGVLVVCLGRFTRLNEWLSAGEKTYEATFHLGATSDTYDAQGCITPTSRIKLPSADDVVQHVQSFTGTIEQIPPAFSAVKVRGVPSYKLARRNQAAPLQARRVHIAEIEVREYDFPLLKLRIVCSRGTYIRSLAADLGERLGCGGYVQELKRCRVGTLGLDIAFSLQQIREAVARGQLEQCFVAPHAALDGLRPITLGAHGLQRFAHGNPVQLEQPCSARDNLVCAVYDRDLTLYGIAQWDVADQSLRPLKVLRQSKTGGYKVAKPRL
jgi:tRNA pseudouridine55 synthase